MLSLHRQCQNWVEFLNTLLVTQNSLLVWGTPTSTLEWVSEHPKQDHSWENSSVERQTTARQTPGVEELSHLVNQGKTQVQGFSWYNCSTRSLSLRKQGKSPILLAIREWNHSGGDRVGFRKKKKSQIYMIYFLCWRKIMIILPKNLMFFFSCSYPFIMINIQLFIFGLSTSWFLFLLLQLWSHSWIQELHLKLLLRTWYMQSLIHHLLIFKLTFPPKIPTLWRSRKKMRIFFIPQTRIPRWLSIPFAMMSGRGARVFWLFHTLWNRASKTACHQHEEVEEWAL